MSITLRADNRTLIKDAVFSYLLDNVPSMATSLSVVNPSLFSSNDIILIGNIGSKTSEVLQIDKVDAINNKITFKNFSDVAYGGGLSSVVINNPGAGYEIGQILTVIDGGNSTGKIRVSGVGSNGEITSIFLDQNESGFGYSVSSGVETTGGGNNQATINILTVTTASNSTKIIFENSRNFVAGQPVEVKDPATNASKGIGIVKNSEEASKEMELEGSGIPNVAPGDIVIVGNISRYSHSESTRVTIIQYNAIRFFRTETPSVPNYIPHESITSKQNKSITQTTKKKISAPHTTVYRETEDPSVEKRIDYTPPIVFQGAQALTEPMDINVGDYYTSIFDKTNSTGYGWFAFLNKTTNKYSPISNPIPYSGFAENTVKKVFETFDSSINIKDLQLVTSSDRYNWLNEGLSVMVNELNLGNWEYFSSNEMILEIKAGVSKYLLPEDFSEIIYINGEGGIKMNPFNLSHQRASGGPMTYAIRGKTIVFNPTPAKDGAFTFAYLKSAPTLKNLDDVLDLPDNAYYAVQDYMRFRAYQKLDDNNSSIESLALFNKKIENMKIYASKRDKALDSFSMSKYSNI